MRTPNAPGAKLIDCFCHILDPPPGSPVANQTFPFIALMCGLTGIAAGGRPVGS
jgi:hypothetical protein